MIKLMLNGLGLSKKTGIAVFYYIGFDNIVTGKLINPFLIGHIGFCLYLYTSTNIVKNRYVQLYMDVLVLIISVPVFFNQYLPILIGTYIDKTVMSNYKWTHRFCLYLFPLNQVS